MANTNYAAVADGIYVFSDSNGGIFGCLRRISFNTDYVGVRGIVNGGFYDMSQMTCIVFGD
jgi:hypothetical protein|tara:strand:- start:1331 stop:1513 length:183 start_codon:yes stop_codon:yes gene_type:complete